MYYTHLINLHKYGIAICLPFIAIAYTQKEVSPRSTVSSIVSYNWSNMSLNFLLTRLFIYTNKSRSKTSIRVTYKSGLLLLISICSGVTANLSSGKYCRKRPRAGIIVICY